MNRLTLIGGVLASTLIAAGCAPLPAPGASTQAQAIAVPAAAAQHIRVVQETITVVDPTLMAALKEYPRNAVNGAYLKQKTRDGEESFVPSLVVPIPRDPAECRG